METKTEQKTTGRKLDMSDVLAAAEREDGTGFCLACGCEAEWVEPDARRYECGACGAAKVYGAEEIVMMYG